MTFMFWSKRAAIEVSLFPESPSGPPMRDICSPPHRISIGKSASPRKEFVKSVRRFFRLLSAGQGRADDVQERRCD
jgi:hypothetical protein